MHRPEKPETPEERPASAEASVCAANLGPRQSARRLRLVIVPLVAGAVGLVILVHREMPAATRLALFPIWWAGIVGILEARRRT
jgi:hypothetical protein